MRNLAMQRKLDEGWLVDVSKMPRLGGYYLIPWDEETATWEAANVDFADCETEEWIWSIGRVLKTFTIHGVNNIAVIVQKDQVLASTTTDLYAVAKDYVECLWLR